MNNTKFGLVVSSTEGRKNMEYGSSAVLIMFFILTSVVNT